MPDDIERIVDRKLIKQRVHYYVVWKGFGQENNTWESRIDLMADGYSDIIKSFESQDNNEEEKKEKKHKESPRKTSPTAQSRRSPRYKDNNNEENVKETPRRRSTRNQTMETSSSTQFVSRLDEEDESVLRSTIAALTPHVREMTPPAASTEHKKPVTLSYEEEEESVLLKPQSNEKTATSESSATISHDHEHASPAQNGLIAKAVESGYLASFLSVAAVVGSLVVSQMLPRDADETELWRRWLSFLTPVVALLLFFHQKDARASAKWVATGLAWRAAAELLLLISDTPPLLIAVVSILRNREHEHSKSTLALLTVGVLTLFLSDSWVISAENSELESRVILMSMAVLTIALSPMPTVSSEDDD
ncbi:hypothetical protein AM587_10007673 [Phytophthora nicotianae]|uniref:Chromo domain-containing protein n=1 Tax=Phytophthora nicotianae TaxID=4792 RepID=A0A0W8D041_PHYNI|nr:hypothetical protein AM587_10007673 [Phytophthora nicotianae]